MPGKVRVRIEAGRNLPIMDRSNYTTDAYVEVKMGSVTYKTDVCRKSLNPSWNSDWFRFEMDDLELQDEPLQIRLMDYDTYSANDAIGRVYLDLNPLLLPPHPLSVSALRTGKVDPNTSAMTGGTVLNGWIPVYDTMHGIRGEVKLTVKVELFTDLNKFRQSSCGVQFFCTPAVPEGYCAQAIHGFVQELVVNDDPEYQWIDKIRTSRASNEARQTLFSKLSGEVQRKMGSKTIELGGNAVIGFGLCFDVEGESGIVVRGIGTAVTLIRLLTYDVQDGSRMSESPIPEEIADNKSNSPTNISHTPTKHSPAIITTPISNVHRKLSDGDLNVPSKSRNRKMAQDNSTELMEYPYLTITRIPHNFVLYLGGVVSTRSVKLLERISNLEEPESRDGWWTEIRKEIRSHARVLGCNVVLGYSEHTSICDDVCILSASGTAAIVNIAVSGESHDVCTFLPTISSTSNNRDTLEPITLPSDRMIKDLDKDPMYRRKTSGDQIPSSPCSLCHVPYSVTDTLGLPFTMTTSLCAVCKKGKVPDVLFSTTEPPPTLPFVGKGCFIQAQVCRSKRDWKGELLAKEMSDSLPFLEYELHRQLINKLKVKGMNAIFGFQIQVTLGERLLVGIATGTAMYLQPLPAPPLPIIKPGNMISGSQMFLGVSPHLQEKKLYEMQCRIEDARRVCIETYQIRPAKSMEIDGDYVDDGDKQELDLTMGNKNTYIIEVDDANDVDILSQLLDPIPPRGFWVLNTETPADFDLEESPFNISTNGVQLFTQVWRGRISSQPSSQEFSLHFTSLLQSIYFKLRKLAPCIICKVQFRVELPEPDEIQLSVVGMAVSINQSLLDLKPKQAESGIVFPIDDFHMSSDEEYSASFNNTAADHKPKIQLGTLKEKYGIDITPLSFIPGTRIKKYVGNLNFFFIRECTNTKEVGGLSGFVHSFVTEVLAIVRAHVAALGGNAMVAYFMSECVLSHNAHKNQAQCLINVGGDVVQVTYLTPTSSE